MLSQFGIEAPTLQLAIAILFILSLLLLFGWVLRRFAGGRLMLPGQERGRARQPRLGIVDIYDLDRQRQLILLRRDNVEHLLLIGGPNDVVIETNIVRVAGARLPTMPTEPVVERPDPVLDRPAFEPQARPQVEPLDRQSLEAQIAARLGALAGRPSEGADKQQDGVTVGAASASAPARVEPAMKPDLVTVSTDPARRPMPPVPPRPTAVPSGEPPAIRPEPRVGAPGLRPVPSPAPSPAPAPDQRPTPPRVAPPRPPEPVPPAAPAPDTRAPDAAILSDMAKQLEQALKRPTNSAAEPTPAPPRVPEQPRNQEQPRVQEQPRNQEPPRGQDKPRGDDMRDNDATRQDRSRADERRVMTPPAEEPQGADNADRNGETPAPVQAPPARPRVSDAPPVVTPVAPPPAAVEPPRPPAEPARPVPGPAPAPPAAPAAPAAAAPVPQPPTPASAPASAPRSVDDPFSVEEIEAEFARLLGRPVDKDKGSTP